MHTLFKWNLLVSALLVVQFTLQLDAQAADLTSQYDQLYPYRFEACSLTDAYKLPYKPRFDWGHIVIFMSGVCRDESANIPKVKACDPNRTGNGVTISVNSRTRNVNWLAVPGKSLSFFGSDSLVSAANPRVTQASVDILKEHLKSLGIYKGIDIYPEDGDNNDLTAKNEVLAQASITMEAGITFARNLNCVKLPVTQPQVAETVSYLNSLNDKYFKSRNFKWSPLFNNCAHLVHNVLAKINVWEFKNVDTPLLGIVKNAAVPGNEPLDLINVVYNSDLDDPLAIYNNPNFKKSLFENNWLPVRHGVLMQQVNITASENDLFSGKKIAFHTLQLPDSEISYSQFVKQITGEMIYTDLATNLHFFQKKYLEAIKNKQSVEAYLTSLQPSQARDFVNFYNRYYSYLSTQLDDVNHTLKNYEN